MLQKWVDYVIIYRSGYFDPAYYLHNYSDCRRADIDPLFHYIKSGWKEKRNPSDKFDTEFYLSVNPDVKQAGINPLVHYLRNGRKEGREPLPGLTSLPPKAFKKNRLLDSLLHVLYKAGRNVYWWIPSKQRQIVLSWLLKYFGFLFKGLLHNRSLRNNQEYAAINAFSQHPLIDIKTVQPAIDAGGSIAVHIHIFYHDLLQEFVKYLENMPFPYDLFISVSNDEALEQYQQAFAHLPFCKAIQIKQVANRGRDIAPMFCTFGEELAGYNYIAHLHSKKSTYNKGATEGWREYLCNNLLGSRDDVRRIVSLMKGEQPYGIVYPQNYSFLPYWANTWLANKDLGQVWCARLGIRDVPRGYFDYPASSMFWARGDALAPLFKSGLTLDNFPEESGQTDGTLAHCLERLFVLCSLKQDMRPGIIKDKTYPSWSVWRIDQYTNRSNQDVMDLITSSKIKLIAFDIFDTLFCRPLLDPEAIKTIVARRIGGEAGRLYQEFRAIAERQAREVKGRDVGMDEIYSHFGEMSGISQNRLTEIRAIEEEIEGASLEPRPEALSLFQNAVHTGKPVVLMTDMFLPEGLIEKWLRRAGIDAWDGLFVSNEIGLRKDNGTLYNHVLSHYVIKPAELLMIGDNERSDVQIPCDMGASFIHFLKPVEFARGLPRFSDLIAQHERRGDIDAEITLGLVIRKNFNPIHLQDIDPVSLVRVTPYYWGYSLVGPLLLSFSNWLLQKTREDGIDRLYFLSREGKVIKQVYDQWSERVKNAPKSEYLVLSRRAAGVAAITTLKDILEISKTTYYSNTLENFLYTRYGLTLGEERWSEISQTLGCNRNTEISVIDRRINHLEPLLQILESEIITRTQNEGISLIRYLKDKGLNHDDRQAAVDIGYGGTVQGYVNKLLENKVHGYYMMTDERSRKIADDYKILIRGCYSENIKKSSPQPTMFRFSFSLEKLLSSDDPQIEYYELDTTGNVNGHYRDMSVAETECSEIRRLLQQGAMDYVRDACRVRETMLPDFQPSCWTAQMLLDNFLVQKSPKETELLSKIVLDDHYCGRGLVS